ncbi:MAG: hypothetical protein NZ899_08290 [Thermoguttaceae bacterium]|nr:hypothetical protein [Thermoguttaceae bacterium]MDW8078385.1 hypothetical protein [Thermoguttaceae bacterium]
MLTVPWSRRIVVGLWLSLGWVAAYAFAQEFKPHVVVSVASYDELKADLRYLGGLFGNAQIADAFEGLILMSTRGQGLLVWDRTRRWGMALQIPEADVSQSLSGEMPGVFILPVTNLKQFLTAIEGLVGAAEEVSAGVYRVSPPDQEPVFFQSKGRWVVATQQRDLLRKLPADPGKLLEGAGTQYDLVFRLNFGALPSAAQEALVEQLKREMQQGLIQAPTESDEQFRRRQAAVESFLAWVEDGYTEVDELAVGLRIDRARRAARTDLLVTVLPGSAGERALKQLAPEKSTWSRVAELNPTLLFGSSVKVSGPVAEDLRLALEDLRKQALAEAEEEADQEEVSLRQSLVNHLFDALSELAKQPNWDWILALWTKPGEPLALFAARTAEVTQVNRLLREIARSVEKRSELEAVVEPELAVEGDVTLHRIRLKIPKDEENREKLVEFLGQEEVELAAGVGSDRVILAAGVKAIDRIREVLNLRPSSDSQPEKVSWLTMEVGGLAEMGVYFGEESSEQRNQAAQVAEAAKKLGVPARLEISVLTVPRGLGIGSEINEGFLKLILQLQQAQAIKPVPIPTPGPVPAPPIPPGAAPPSRPEFRLPPSIMNPIR